MHIPESMMHGRICPVTATVSAVSLIAAAKAVKKIAQEDSSAYRMGGLCALVFALQMLNFPVTGGTSGHFTGGMLLAAALGLPRAIIGMTLILAAQAFLFADGGLSVLGANVLNMAVIGPVCGWAVFKLLSSKTGNKPALALASLISVVAAATFCGVELGISGAVAFSKAVPAMAGIHALIGAAEAVITVVLIGAVGFAGQEGKARSGAAVATALACAAVIAAPFASVHPDGLEWVAAKYGFLKANAPLFAAPMPDYSLSAVSLPALSVIIAGTIGAAVCFAAAYMAAKAFGKAN